jgi:hypothetical protein
MELWVAIAGLTANAVALIVMGVWVIGKINAQAAVLAEALSNLNKSLVEQRKWTSKIDEKVDTHDSKIAVLEEKTK